MSSQDHSPTENQLSNFVQIAFLNAQNVENAFEWPLYIMKHRFIDNIKVDIHK
jgi:hypothetical protein